MYMHTNTTYLTVRLHADRLLARGEAASPAVARTPQHEGPAAGRGGTCYGAPAADDAGSNGEAHRPKAYDEAGDREDDRREWPCITEEQYRLEVAEIAAPPSSRNATTKDTALPK